MIQLKRNYILLEYLLYSGVIIALFAILNFFSEKKISQKDNNIESVYQYEEEEIKRKIKQDERILNKNIEKSSYVKFKILRIEERYFDEETGFRFYLSSIEGYNSFLGKKDGAFCSYVLPSGERGKHLRRRIGETIEFDSKNKKFIARIYEIDYKFETLTLEIKELKK